MEIDKEKIKKISNELDFYVGRKLKARREKLGLNQADLAELIGVSYQQIQKYERGENKIAAGRLFQIADVLKVSTDFFFQGNNFFVEKESENNFLNIKRTKPLNILLVEDNPVDEMLSMEAFKQADFPVNIFVVHDGNQVIQYLRKTGEFESAQSPDLVVLDVNISKRSGCEVLKEIRRDRTLNGMPVIILTNSISPKDFTDLYQYNISGYISKTFDAEEFYKKVNSIVNYWHDTVVLPSMQNDT